MMTMAACRRGTLVFPSLELRDTPAWFAATTKGQTEMDVCTTALLRITECRQCAQQLSSFEGHQDSHGQDNISGVTSASNRLSGEAEGIRYD